MGNGSINHPACEFVNLPYVVNQGTGNSLISELIHIMLFTDV